MNRRVIIFLSIGLIVVGVLGIFLNSSSEKPTKPQSVAAVKVFKAVEKKNIVIAEALKELNPKDILQASDYSLKTVEIDKDSQDPRDIHALGVKNINGFLNLNHVVAGNAIITTGLESPDSKTFALHSLKGNEIFWDYYFRAHDNYLASLTAGQKVSLYLRSAMLDPQKEKSPQRVPMDGNSAGRNVKKFEINHIAGPLDIIAVNRLDTGKSKDNKEGKEKEAKPKADNSNLKKELTNDSYVGWLTLRIQSSQLAKLKSVEKSGEIIAIPGGNEAAVKRMTADQILPQMHKHNVTELRGGK